MTWVHRPVPTDPDERAEYYGRTGPIAEIIHLEALRRALVQAQRYNKWLAVPGIDEMMAHIVDRLPPRDSPT